jgi:cation-transporting P-type ATPase I
MRLFDWFPSEGFTSLRNIFGHHQRRIYHADGRAHLELRTHDPIDLEAFSDAVAQAFAEMPGVHWTEINAVLGRLVIAYDEDICSVEMLVRILENVEGRFHLDEQPLVNGGPDHPGDAEPIARTMVRIGADALGVVLGTTLRMVRKEPSEGGFDLAALMSVVENTPHIRRHVSKRIGHAAADVGLGITNAFVQAIGSGPITPLVDIPYQYVRLQEALARHRTWREREPGLFAHPGRAEDRDLEVYTRPNRTPDGPIERYADDAWQVSLGGFAVGLADTQDFKRAVTPLLDALPKPARFGREAYCAQIGRALSRRGVLILDPKPLRRLDRIDFVVIDDDLLFTDTLDLERVVPVEPIEWSEAHHQACMLFDPDEPDKTCTAGPWKLIPADRLKTRQITKRWREKARALTKAHPRSGPALALLRDDRLIALFETRYTLNPAAEQLLATVRRGRFVFILATDDDVLARDFGPDRCVAKGKDLVHEIRHEQRDNHVICLLARGACPALSAADLSLAFPTADGPLPWSADLMGYADLDEATFLIEAAIEARRISQQSVTLAGAGAGIGAFSAIQGLKHTPPGRITLAVNSASLIAMGNGLRAAAALDRRIRPVHTSGPPWHAMPSARVLDALDSRDHGLTSAEALKRQKEPPLERSRRLALAQSIFQELANPLTPVLAVGAAVSAVVGSVTDAGIVGAVIGVNALIGGVERYKAEQVIADLARREVDTVNVLRDREEVVIESSTLVPGDVIWLESGDVVPADCRILEAEFLEVDESSLTGESLPVTKGPELSFASALAERSSMLFEGTAIAVGEVKAVVVATGEDTEMRRAVHRTARDSPPRSGVEARLEDLTDLTLPFATTSGALMMSFGILRRQKLQELVGPAVNLAVAAVPEGLPLLATAAQLSAARRLSHRGVLVRNPRAMEALGRVDVVCADKTGTLTEGRIRLHSIDDGQTTQTISQLDTTHCSVLAAALRSTPEEPDEGILPHATDRAVVEGARRVQMTATEDRPSWRRVEELPFKSDRGFHAVLGRTEEGHLITVKGAPEEVIPRCSRRLNDGSTTRLDARGRARLFKQVDRLAGEGLRILAIAEKTDTQINGKRFSEDDVEKLTFLGFVALSDPLRETSRQAVQLLHEAGVDVLMITGDHASTAARIAVDVGLSRENGILTGAELDRMDDEALDEAINHIKVIARATPNHKVRIVESLQRKGRVVAMTGDGGNDAPAIRLADVGIALGQQSTSAARDSADLVVTDERIETIVDAIIEGRAMWASVRDAVSILIGGNLGEVGFMVTSGLLSRTPALNARQLLLVNLFTDVAPAMAIALRPPPEVTPETLLKEGPEASLGGALNRDILWRAIITGSAGVGSWLFARTFFMKNAASTVGLLSAVGAQLGQTLVAGKPSKPVLAASIGSALGLLAIVQTPGLSQLFGCQPLGPRGLLTAAGATGLATAASLVAPAVAEQVDAILARRRGESAPIREEQETRAEFEDLDSSLEITHLQG